MISEFFTGIVTDCLLWPPGAGLKKLMGRPLSETGNGERWLGLLVCLAIILVGHFAFNVV